jgi:hypothetical protein
MAYKIDDNTSRVMSTRTQKISLAVRFGIEGIHRASTPNTPKKTGQLRNNVIKRVSGKSGSITWRSNHAGAQEAGYMTVRKTRTFKTAEGAWVTLKPGRYYFKKYTTPGTGSRYASNAAIKEGGNPRKYLRMAGL